MSAHVAQEVVGTLETRTERWVAGLQLAAIVLQESKGDAAALALFSGRDRNVADYLMTEVFQHQPEFIQHFLLQTSMMERFNADLCNTLSVTSKEMNPSVKAVAESTDAQQILEQLDRSDLFIVPLDTERLWFRYHHLFSELLRIRLRLVATQEQINAIHLRAASWFEANDWLEEAISHGIQAEDYDYAAQLILKIPDQNLWRQRAGDLMRGWGDKLPSETIRRFLRLLSGPDMRTCSRAILNGYIST